VTLVRNKIDDLMNGKIDPSELVISRSVREESQYKAGGNMINVRVFKKLKELGYEVVPGMKVSWVVTDSKASPQNFEPWVEGRPFAAKPDYRYYATRLAATIARVTDSFGWDERSLLSGIQQSTFKGSDIEEKRAKKHEPKKTDKKLSLDQFM
jgi:DNA polymerase I